MSTEWPVNCWDPPHSLISCFPFDVLLRLYQFGVSSPTRFQTQLIQKILSKMTILFNWSYLKGGVAERRRRKYACKSSLPDTGSPTSGLPTGWQWPLSWSHHLLPSKVSINRISSKAGLNNRNFIMESGCTRNGLTYCTTQLWYHFSSFLQPQKNTVSLLLLARYSFYIRQNNLRSSCFTAGFSR